MTGFAVHLMRHGCVEGAGRLLGHTDAPALPEGDAVCLARSKGLAFAQVICSDLARARKVATRIARDRHVPLISDPRWRELDFGAWDALDPKELPGAALQRFWSDPDANPPPNGERWSGIVARVGEAWRDIAADVLILTHAGAIRAVLAHVFGFSHAQCWAIDLPYAAVLSLRIWEGEPRSAQIIGLLA